MRSILPTLLLLVPMLAGCLGSEPGGPTTPPSHDDPLPAGHPWPAADAWPDELSGGSFSLGELRHERVESFDGTVLDGWIYLPDLPEGVEAPVVLWSHPYFGQTYPWADEEAIRDNSRPGEAVPIDLLVRHGYAVAAFSVRGSGHSGGCYDDHGPAEQRDQVVLVEWLAEQSWSNGRVGMMGLSYHGTTPWEAAIQSPRALKTIVVAGMISDLYTFMHTPQGAVFTESPSFTATFTGVVTGPPVLGAMSQERPPGQRETAAWAPVAPERLCPEVAQALARLTADPVADERPAAYFTQRRLVDGLPNVTAAVLLTHGFQDQWGSGHQLQEAEVWRLLPDATPKHQLEGQWKHEFPNFNSLDPEWALDDWNATLLAWLDFWLKGQGPVPDQLDTVRYQDGSGAWHDSESWPPAEARQEALYLSKGGLVPTPSREDVTFRSVPEPVYADRAWAGTGAFPGPLCAPPPPEGQDPVALLLTGEPVERDVVVAGNPFAYLHVESDQPGGLVAVTLLDLAPDFHCDDRGVPHGATAWVQGVADLRFHQGRYHGSDFPVDQPTPVRVDLVNLAEVLPEGHRLAALVSYGDPYLRVGQPFTPTIILHGDDGAEASHLVVPVVEGTLGGNATAMDYPPRPFLPR